ncbi:hypothetical protein SAMN05216516_11211 [Izhakiella capsodis]|uniref:Uncharacterized protein n=1 Tax=Izhakiella capsodis TaxID=1367852 RepID=A0A1I5AHB7_9GAMM|nr:DUF6387 family protein [Izhakiella capsodis]SFN61896.1 hypothetical protein SAMN05216516_11211 [Izhakiella capsodis]
MVTAAKKVELTKWFKPENYNVLKDITVLQLCQEIRKRKAIFEELEEALESDEPEWCVSQANLEERELIFSGKPLIASGLTEDDVESYTSDQHVRLMTAGKLYQLEKDIKNTGLLNYGENTVKFFEENNRYWLQQPILRYKRIYAQQLIESRKMTDVQKKNLALKAGSAFNLEINLSLSTDNQIIESLRYLLDRWRKQTGIKPKLSQFTYGFGEAMVLKIVDFRVIPILDLLYHAKLNNYKLSDKDLEQLLYRWGMEGCRDQVQIKETDRPLAKKALTNEFDNLFTMFLYKNRHLMDMKVSEVYKMNEREGK